MGALGGSGAMEALGVIAAQHPQSLQMHNLRWHQRPQSRLRSHLSNRKQRQTSQLALQQQLALQMHSLSWHQRP